MNNIWIYEFSPMAKFSVDSDIIWYDVETSGFVETQSCLDGHDLLKGSHSADARYCFIEKTGRGKNFEMLACAQMLMNFFLSNLLCFHLPLD